MSTAGRASITANPRRMSYVSWWGATPKSVKSCHLVGSGIQEGIVNLWSLLAVWQSHNMAYQQEPSENLLLEPLILARERHFYP